MSAEAMVEERPVPPPARPADPSAIGLRGKALEREPMSRHVSWRAGGVADRAYIPADLEDLQLYVRSRPANEPIYFVGLGSNLLVRDAGLRGTVVFVHWALRELRIAAVGDEGGEIYAEAGVASPKVARQAALHNYGGAEFLAGIPGTVGGALAMNAGCYGGETWDIVDRVTTMDRHGALHDHAAADYRIAYRSVTPRVPAAEEWFIAAVFALDKGDGVQSRRMIKELLNRRISTQPLGMPNAGSVFRNPPGNYAARLIEQCGLKGAVVGGAAISAKHANFIVNNGTASAADIEALIERAQGAVKQKFGIDLEREVRILGDRK